MDYNTYRSEIQSVGSEWNLISVDLPMKQASYDYETVRFGEPNKGLDFDKCSVDRARCIRQARRGWGAGFPHDINSDLLRAVAKLRASIDLWYEMSESPLYCKEEIYIRCLAEGPAFTEFIKKSRSGYLRAHTAETGVDVEEDWLDPAYKGYNSVIHERYLIHWDDRETVDDVKFAFMETKDVPEDEFREMFRNLLEFSKVEKEDFDLSFDMIAQLRNTSMLDPTTGKTTLMREFWKEGIDTNTPFYGKRCVVLTEPGSTRDTAVGDPGTILKVKILNKICRVISERLCYSANAPTMDANMRYKRVLKRQLFLHLDFKKFGLTFPRKLMNIAIKEIERFSGINMEDFDLTDFYLDIDGEVYKTARGTALGWLDCLNALCVAAILHNLTSVENMEFDFIGFNDDVEVSMYDSGDALHQLEILRNIILIECDRFDIPISLSKTYGSRGSIFLERYLYFDRYYDLNMDKTQLTVGAYASSLVAEYPWRAKMLFASSYQWVRSEYAFDRCVATCPKEFSGLVEEDSLPLFSGGWVIETIRGLDTCLLQSGTKHIALGIYLSRWKPPEYSTKVKKVAKQSQMHNAVNKACAYSSSAGLGRLALGDPGQLEDINFEVETASILVNQLSEVYHGKAQLWVIRAVHLLATRSSGVQPPPSV